MTTQADVRIGDGGAFAKRIFEILSVIPVNQELVTVGVSTPVGEAIALLDKHGYSQLPVMNGRKMLGIFTYRSYALAIVAQSRKGYATKPFDPLSLTTGDCMSAVPRFARVTDLFTSWFDEIDSQDFLVVGDPTRAQAIVTACDVVNYLYKIASPYVLIADCELALRAIISIVMPPAVLITAVPQCLADKYPANKVPTSLMDMSLGDYVRIVIDGRWTSFDPIFGLSRNNTRTRLEKLNELRNEVFHNRRDVTPDEHKDLADDREWLRSKVEIAGSLPATEGAR